MKFLHNLKNLFLDFLYPPRCLVCRETGPESFCKKCLGSAQHIIADYCALCGRVHDYNFNTKAKICRSCQEEKPHFDLARSVVLYDSAIKKSLHHLKFAQKTSLIYPLGDLMVRHIDRHLPEIKHAGCEMLVTVPLSDKRLKQRGFNQCDLLAEILSSHYNIPFIKNLLSRIRDTQAQYKLSRLERQKNLQGVFALGSKAVLPAKRILLLDDIYTTGTTANECAKVLKENGAEKVYVLTLSRAVEN